MKAVLVIIAFLGLCAVTHFSQKKAREAAKEAEAAKVELVEAKENLAAADRKVADYKEREKVRTTERDEAQSQLAELEEKTHEDAEKLTELKTNLEDTAKKNEEGKAQMTEVEGLQQKLKEAEEQNAATKAE